MAALIEFFSGNFLSMYFFCCVGSLVLWMKSSARAKHAHSLGDVIENIFPQSERASSIIKFAVFVFFGGLIGVIVVAPASAIQAMSAGVAWSRLAARD